MLCAGGINAVLNSETKENVYWNEIYARVIHCPKSPTARVVLFISLRGKCFENTNSSKNVDGNILPGSLAGGIDSCCPNCERLIVFSDTMIWDQV